MVQVPQAAAVGLAVDEYDYDLFPMSTAGITVAGTVNLTPVISDGYTAKVARLTISNKAATGLITLQIVTAIAGLKTNWNVATQTVFDYQLGGTASVFFSEDQLELVVPAGFQLQAVTPSGGTMDITGHYRYLKGGT